MTLPKINPECPICHAICKGELIRNEENRRWYIQCMNCGNLTDEHDAPEDAIEQWNEGLMIDESI